MWQAVSAAYALPEWGSGFEGLQEVLRHRPLGGRFEEGFQIANWKFAEFEFKRWFGALKSVVKLKRLGIELQVQTINWQM